MTMKKGNGGMSDEAVRRFELKQAKVEAVIAAIGDDWTGETLPSKETLHSLVRAFFDNAGQLPFLDHFSHSYQGFLVSTYLSERRRGQFLLVGGVPK